MRVLIVIFTFITSLTSSSQKKKIVTDEDVTIVLNYMNTLNDGAKKSNERSPSKYTDWTVNNSPDDLFKIFIIGGKARGNPNWPQIFQGYIHFKSGKKIDIGNKFSYVKDIYLISKNQYLVIDENIDVFENGTLSFQIVEISDDNIHSIKLYSTTDKRFEHHTDSGQKRFTVNVTRDGLAQLSYNPLDKKIAYQYTDYGGLLELYYFNDILVNMPPLPAFHDEPILVTGSFKIIDGDVKDFNEQYKKLPKE